MYREIIEKLQAMENPRNIQGMARFGIRPKARALGVPVPVIRKMAKEIKKSLGQDQAHSLAMELFASGLHEARLLASMVACAGMLTAEQIENWVKTFDSWDIVDQTCMNLFDKSKIAVKKISDFAKREAEFEKRTAFALIAALASHSKDMDDKDFLKFFPLIQKSSSDERNFVKKAVNWALRGIGKRNKKLNKEALALAVKIQKTGNKPAKWVAGGAIRELTSPAVIARLDKNGRK